MTIFRLNRFVRYNIIKSPVLVGRVPCNSFCRSVCLSELMVSVNSGETADLLG